VGAGAIRQLATDAGLRIAVVEEWGERLPFPDASFDVVHARQVLHHANDLGRLCAEVHRVLKPGGLLVATREHVISRAEDLDAFLDSHPLHSLYGGENAYTLARYRTALEKAGFLIRRVFAPWESDINLFPQTILDARKSLACRLRWPFPRLIPLWVVRRWSRWLDTPGRLYSFVGAKP
jgi:SAM-dependent methyltransferase